MITQNKIKTVLTFAIMATAILALTAASASAGDITYVPISGDDDSGISTDNRYTHAIDFGNQPAGGGVATVNGVIFADGSVGDFPAIGESSQTVGTGSSTIPNNHSGDAAADAYLTDGGMRELVHDMIYNDATTVITLTGLSSETQYRLRLYHRSWGGTRPQDIGFDTDGVGTDITGAEDTAVFFEDDATQPDPNFATATQVYAFAYDYTLSPGVTTLTIYINQTGTGTYHLYGLTNEETGPVNAGPNMITVSGLAVPLDPSFIDDYTPTSYLWTTDAPAGFTVVFDPSAIVEAPTVTITQDTPSNPSTVTLTLLVNGSDEDTMKIDVYDDACPAVKAAGTAELDPTDIDANCITGLADFALLAKTWLDDYTLTGPAPKP